MITLDSLNVTYLPFVPFVGFLRDSSALNGHFMVRIYFCSCSSKLEDIN